MKTLTPTFGYGLHYNSLNFLGSLHHLYPQTTFIHPSKQPKYELLAFYVHGSRSIVLEPKSKKHETFYKPKNLDQFSNIPISKIHTKTIQNGQKDDDIWLIMKDEARFDIDQEPILSNYYFTSILSHETIQTALSHHLSMKLCNLNLPSTTLNDLFMSILTNDQDIIKSVIYDLKAVKERDPACISYVHCFLNFKGFLACQAHRIAHSLWSQNRKILALLIQNRVSEVLALDIHPGAKIGQGMLLDHGTGVVIGESAVVGDNVSILHNVTLGGTGKSCGDRHPKIGDGVLIGAGTCVLGNVRIGEGAKIGAGTVVVKDVPTKTTVVGNPAKLIGGKDNPVKHDKIPSHIMDHSSPIEFYDYIHFYGHLISLTFFRIVSS